MENITIRAIGIASKNVQDMCSKVFGQVDPNRERIIFCDYSDSDVPLSHVFKIITNKKAEFEIECNVILKQITQEFFLEYDQIPKGHKTICKFEFGKGEIPNVVTELPVINSWEESYMTLIFK